jgi:peptide/nickel transport system permease protein
VRAIAWLVCAATTLYLCSIVARLDPDPPPHAGPWRLALARLRANRPATAALYFLIALYVITLLAPWLAPYDPSLQPDIIALKDRPPSLRHPFGTDFASRDVFSRTLFGARISLSIALLAVLLSVTVGAAYGAVAGYYGGRVDDVMMRCIDAALSIPRILLLIAVLALWGSLRLPALILLLGLTGWFAVSRLVRAQVLSLKEREMVLAARALGARDRGIIWHHILPNVLSPVIVAATLDIGNVIILEAGLSYLGIGVRQPAASWGNIIQDGADQVVTLWWMTLFPGLAIVLTVMAFNLLGDGLRDALDPRQLPRE